MLQAESKICLEDFYKPKKVKMTIPARTQTQTILYSYCKPTPKKFCEKIFLEILRGMEGYQSQWRKATIR